MERMTNFRKWTNQSLTPILNAIRDANQHVFAVSSSQFDTRGIKNNDFIITPNGDVFRFTDQHRKCLLKGLKVHVGHEDMLCHLNMRVCSKAPITKVNDTEILDFIFQTIKERSDV